MLANSVIIVSSGQSEHAASGALDRHIEALLKIKKNPILVIGPDGDDLLRHCSRIEDCELVFDPNFEGSFFSGVKAGLHATNGAAFVLSLSENFPKLSVWKTLEVELVRSLPFTGGPSAAAVIRAVTHNVDPTPEPTLQVVTSSGAQILKSLPASTDWTTSERITFRTIEAD